MQDHPRATITHGDVQITINRGELQPAGVVVGIRWLTVIKISSLDAGGVVVVGGVPRDNGVARVVGVVHKEHAVVGKVWVKAIDDRLHR